MGRSTLLGFSVRMIFCEFSVLRILIDIPYRDGTRTWVGGTVMTLSSLYGLSIDADGKGCGLESKLAISAKKFSAVNPLVRAKSAWSYPGGRSIHPVKRTTCTFGLSRFIWNVSSAPVPSGSE